MTFLTDRSYNLTACYLIIGRIKLGVGWVAGFWQLEDCWMIALNREVSWDKDRAVCLSVLWIRIGFQVL